MIPLAQTNPTSKMHSNNLTPSPNRNRQSLKFKANHSYDLYAIY